MEQQSSQPMRKLSQEVNVQENIPQPPSKDNHSMSEDIHEALELLALEAQSLSDNHSKRNRVLTKLVAKIQKSGKLYSQYKYNNRDIYDEAIQETWVYIFRRIDQYDPAKGTVINWVNRILEYRCIDVIRRNNRGNTESLDTLEYQDGNISKLDKILVVSNSPTLAEELGKYIEEDPEGIFTAAHVKNHPEANFRAIFLLLREGYQWNAISQKLDTSVGTLSPFFGRQLKKFDQDGRFDDYK